MGEQRSCAALGLLGDSQLIIERAAAYLRRVGDYDEVGNDAEVINAQPQAAAREQTSAES